MMRRLLLLALALNLAVVATTGAQQPNRVPIVGVLMVASGTDDPIFEALRQGLRELGYVEGRNIRIEFRTAQGHADRLPNLAREPVQLNTDAIVVGSTQAAQAVQRATSTIPIVTATFDPLASGLVTNLAHPRGNVTGLSSMSSELSAKRLQLLKETVPRLTRVAVLWNPAMLPTSTLTRMIEDLKAAAPSLSIELSFVGARTTEAFGAAFSAANRAHAQALYVVESALFHAHVMTLAKLSSEARLPAIFGTRAFADDGGLISYGVDYQDQYRRSAADVHKILKGAKPGDLPIEQPTNFELVVNLSAARALGLTIPESILLRANEVIR